MTPTVKSILHVKWQYCKTKYQQLLSIKALTERLGVAQTHRGDNGLHSGNPPGGPGK